MKRLILLCAICATAALTTGCGVVFRTASDVANQVRIGMTVDEFKKLAGQHAQLDSMTPDRTVYRIEHFAGPEDDRYVASVKLYRFDSKGRLAEVETRDIVPPFFPGPGPGIGPGYIDFKPLQ